jgi:hypothetical protein
MKYAAIPTAEFSGNPLLDPKVKAGAFAFIDELNRYVEQIRNQKARVSALNALVDFAKKNGEFYGRIVSARTSR